MADENTQEKTMPQEQTTVTDKPVTDDALASAWEEAQEQTETKVETKTETTEEKEETQQETAEHQEQTEAIPDEPADNAERSRLGRRLKQIEEQNRVFVEQQKQLLDEIKSLRGGEQAPTVKQPAKVPDNVTFDDSFINSQMEAAVERGELPATIVTPQDQWKVNNFINGLQDYIGNQYASRYLGTLQSPALKGETPDDIHAEVVTELQKIESPFNLRRYNNPALDAQMNYLEAKNSILQKRLAGEKPKNVFKGKDPNAPATGTKVSTRTATVEDTMPELDEASQDFIKRTGMTAESVKSAFKESMPYHLRGAVR